MLLKRWLKKLATAGSALTLVLATSPLSYGQATLGQPNCGQSQCSNNCCDWWCCPPPFKYCAESGPCICVKCGCPKPICCPADAPNWGYFQTCWRPYPWGPNWSHCYGTPPASQIVPPGTPGGPVGTVHSMPLQPGTELPGQSSAPRAAMPSSMMVRPGT